MGVGTNAARIGGLAVALGIGAAVVAGHGVAWADPSGEPGSESSSTSSTSTVFSTSTGPRNGASSTSTRPRHRASSKTPVGSSTVSEPTPPADKTVEPSEASHAETPKAPVGSGADNAEADSKRHLEKKRSKIRNRLLVTPPIPSPGRHRAWTPRAAPRWFAHRRRRLLRLSTTPRWSPTLRRHRPPTRRW